MSQGEVDYPVKDFFLADKPQKISCGLTLNLPLETNWQDVYNSVVMFFELNYNNMVIAWEIKTTRVPTGVKIVLRWTVKVRTVYMLNDMDNTIVGIVRKHGLDTTTGISESTRTRCN